MNKLDKLKSILKEYKHLTICYSGGVDSTFLLKVAAETLGEENVVAIVGNGAMMPQNEFALAVEFAKSLNVHTEILELDVLEIPQFKNNEKKRCYHCKTKIMSAIIAKTLEIGGKNVADGKNLDDGKVYRPGALAAQELGIISPLFEAELTKAEIRDLSREYGLNTWNKPSNACLATRFPYGTILTVELLKKVEQAENILANKGFIGARARLHGEILRIETQKENFIKIVEDEQLVQKLKSLDIKFITLDLEGFRSGSMD